MANHLDSETHLKMYGLNHYPQHRAKKGPFPGFGPGLYFPESLSTTPELDDPTQEIELPTMREYVDFLEQGLARAALEQTVEQ